MREYLRIDDNKITNMLCSGITMNWMMINRDCENKLIHRIPKYLWQKRNWSHENWIRTVIAQYIVFSSSSSNDLERFSNGEKQIKRSVKWCWAIKLPTNRYNYFKHTRSRQWKSKEYTKPVDQTMLVSFH